MSDNLTFKFKTLRLPSVLRRHHIYSSNTLIDMMLSTVISVTASVCHNLLSIPEDTRALHSCVSIPTEGIAGNRLAILLKLDLDNKRGAEQSIAVCQHCFLATLATAL